MDFLIGETQRFIDGIIIFIQTWAFYQIEPKPILMKCRSLFLLLTAMLLTFSIASAQSAREASINPDGSIALPTEQVLSELYTVDITSLNFENLEEAVNYFSDFNSELVAIRPNLSNNTAYLFVQKSKKPDWTIEDWNDHLSELVIFDQQ